MDPNSNTIPTAPEMPEMPAVPAMEMPTVPEAPTIPTAPEMPDLPQMEMPTIPDMPTFDPELVEQGPEQAPVQEQPTFNPATMATPGANDTFTMPEQPVAPQFGATDPLTMPEGPQAPDPVEEELKMPLKAAGPVPGSIGSAVSMSMDGKIAEAPKQNNPFANLNAKKNATNTAQVLQQTGRPAMKKKSSKSSMILIGVLGAIVIVALVVVLIMQLQ